MVKAKKVLYILDDSSLHNNMLKCMLNTLLRPLCFALFILWVLSDRDVYPLYFSLCNRTSTQSMAVLTIHIMLVARLGIKAFPSVLYPD